MTQDKYSTVDVTIDKAIQRAIGLGEQLTDEQKRRILQDRARALAQPITEDDSQTGETFRVLSFSLGGEVFAFPAASVTSVNKSIAITPVPCVPSFVAGITNLRGHIRSVVYLGHFLGYDATDTDKEDEYVVVTQHGDMEVAFIVTGLDEVTDIPTRDIKPRPMNTSSKANQYIAGIVPGGLILLDLAAIFTDARFIVNDEIV